ncbi:two-component sensor histidine kinase [Bacillus pseudomycoides]|uniref:HAMP domain-containing sensor histidine kinase n=1 Tax=Bacillus TaxID=1386 RepID=UPI000BEBD65E|nr:MULTISPECIES: HAMP domain-containing sensor histidine kinase [Bacillus]MCX2827541.1 HAMP domain-containing sensor histidine kinase [Bacillus sp. DHT2]MDR4917213.1 HAMP domain-containing sensor histidine kinase [Bacillus pseudomycoides]PDX99013.1 two-component sensor histidine kinase [Bacillus pseudomycoides]PEB42755.1 two-component sensor histidine kinase [Bacillus pseudomycoides]PEK79815.1 two-component sensor histidine kinase [Bacillus pseudomycoides]
MSLKRNMVLGIVGLLIPILFLLYTVIYIALEKNMYHNAAGSLEKLSVEAQIYTMNYLEKEAEVETLGPNSLLIASYLAKRMDIRVQMIGKNGEVVADTEKGALLHKNIDIDQSLRGKKAYVFENDDPAPLLLFSSPVYHGSDVIGAIRFINELQDEKEVLTNVSWTFLVTSICLVAGGIFFAIRLAKSLHKPIDQLRQMAKRLANGDYKSKIELNEYVEIAQLSASFNAMADAIELHMRQLKEEKEKQKDFLDRITHELKTPLTAIIGYVDLIPKLQSARDVEESLHYVSIESQRLLSLVEELLQSSKYGTSTFEVSPTIVDIKQIVEEAISIVKPRLQQYEIEVINELTEAHVVADFDKTKQIFLNVFDNAIKYSDATQLRMNVAKNEEEAKVFIHDDGIGMDEAILAEWNRSREGKVLSSSYGNGYGLFICQEIMTKQGGSMRIESSEEMGTLVVITFLLPRYMEDIKNLKAVK